MHKALVLALTAAMAGPALADTAQDGARYFQKGDYSHALAAWRPLADQGNAIAQNGLGIMYLNGKGVTQNTSEALRYMSLSAASGSPLGQNNLGGLYRDGKGVTRDYAKAAQWFSAAAAQGNSAGMYNLGLMYETGQGMKADLPRSYMWYALAADQSDAPNADAHRDALLHRMSATEQSEARRLTATCKASNFRGCR
ncbi:MAG TPA: tetratricopeptide repeat protein [Rhizomicrobium sp.]|nr:tetratricopeptide repeat protein [Rhizomicrobium sp.]